MNRHAFYAILALALTSHSLCAQPQYCTINFTGRLQTNLGVSTTVSPVYNNVNNQCTNWAVSVSFPDPVVNPTLSFTGSWDASGKPGTFAPLPPNCLAGGSLSTEVGGAPSSMAVVNPMLFTGNGGWGDVVFNNCYFPYLQLSISAQSFPATGVFQVPVRASGSAGINPVAAVFAQPAPPSGGGGGGGPTVQSVAAPWFGSPTGSRAPEVIYTNLTGKSIYVSIVNVAPPAQSGQLEADCDTNPGGPTTLVASANHEGNEALTRTIFFIVPPGYHYIVHTVGLNIPGQGQWVEWN
jgi:hypothetical protein